ncbi:MAG: TonB-dependent receptor plug domain-containing protein [Bacteroidota bacterium]
MRHIFIFSLACLWPSSQLWAQNNSDNRDTIPRGYTLQETVISASRFEQSAATVAQQVRVIDSTRIASAQAQTTADLLSSQAGVHVQKSQAGGGSIVLRGFEASRIAMVIDGVRMNNLIYRAGHLQNLITTDNQSLERVEVLFGPSSTMYGSDALGGVVCLFTKQPTFQSGGNPFSGSVMTRYSSANNELTGNIQIRSSFKKFATYTSFTWSEFDDVRGGKKQNFFYDNLYGFREKYVECINGVDSLVTNSKPELQIGSAYKQHDLVQRFAFKSSDRVTHGLNLQYSNSSDVPRYDRLTDPSSSGLKFSEWYYGPQSRLMAAYELKIERPESKISKTHMIVSRQWVEESRYTRKFRDNNRQARVENVDVTAMNLSMQSLHGESVMNYGLDMQYDQLKSTAVQTNIVTLAESPISTRYPGGNNYMAQGAAFWSHTWQVSDRLEVVDGLRLGQSKLHAEFTDTTFYPFPYENADQSNFVWSASFGLVHRPQATIKQSLLFSTGFRVPNMDDLSKVFESQPGVLIVPNKDLGPEKTYNVDWSLQKFFRNGSMVSLAAYYTSFKDAIIDDAFQLNGSDSVLYDGENSAVYAPQNKRAAYVCGADLRINVSINDKLSVESSVSYTYGRIKTDSVDVPLDHIPPLMANARLNYKNRKTSIGLTADLNGWKRLKDYYLNGEDNEQYATADGMPAWLVFGIRGSYDITTVFKASAGVGNILDTQYRTFASGINAPGRNLWASLRYAF